MRFAILAAFGLLFCSCNIRLPVEKYREPTCANPHKLVGKKTVWLHSDGYHTGLVFPYGWLLDSGYVPPKGLGNPESVVVSWGNTDAYSEHGIGSIHNWFQVIFTPTESVMELIGIDRSPISAMPNQDLWKAEFPAERGPRLAHFLNQCTKTDPQGNPIIIRPSSWGEGLQVDSRFDYFIPRVCNIWSAQAIESLGGPINPWRATTASGLTRQLEKGHGFVHVHKAR